MSNIKINNNLFNNVISCKTTSDVTILLDKLKDKVDEIMTSIREFDGDIVDKANIEIINILLEIDDLISKTTDEEHKSNIEDIASRGVERIYFEIPHANMKVENDMITIIK